MSWLKKNWLWVALGGGVLYLIAKKKTANVATPGGTPELSTSQYTTNAGGELVGEDIDKIKAFAMFKLGERWSGVVSVVPGEGGSVLVTFDGSLDGKPFSQAVQFASVAKALAAVQAGAII
jgi:hypothetical protein